MPWAEATVRALVVMTDSEITLSSMPFKRAGPESPVIWRTSVPPVPAVVEADTEYIVLFVGRAAAPV
jgi:hypothetical protein